MGVLKVPDQREPEILLPLSRVAEQLAVSVRTIHRLIAGGELPRPVKVGSQSRLPASEVHGYIERLKRGRA